MTRANTFLYGVFPERNRGREPDPQKDYTDHLEKLEIVPGVQPAEARHLGKKTDYKFEYDPSLLVPVDRQENRTPLGISGKTLPFVGYDIWNCYEVSCLTPHGAPVVGILKIKYPCNSKYLVESKSLKLYLNSFNMTKMGDGSAEDARLSVCERVTEDLSKALETNVEAKIFHPDHMNRQASLFDGFMAHTFKDLDWEGNIDDLRVEEYEENPKLLEFTPYPIEMQQRPQPVGVYSNLLRSNCKITKQPDWGTVFIYYQAGGELTPESLLKYLISFRNENHFHEEVCETIYKRLWDLLRPFELMVACFYTRRGGIDINPMRASQAYLLKMFDQYLDAGTLSFKFPRQ